MAVLKTTLLGMIPLVYDFTVISTKPSTALFTALRSITEECQQKNMLSCYKV